MNNSFILKPKDLPRNSFIVATNKDLVKLQDLADQLCSYLNTAISKNVDLYRLHIIYKQELMLSGSSYEEKKTKKED